MIVVTYSLDTFMQMQTTNSFHVTTIKHEWQSQFLHLLKSDGNNKSGLLMAVLLALQYKAAAVWQ